MPRWFATSALLACCVFADNCEAPTTADSLTADTASLLQHAHTHAHVDEHTQRDIPDVCTDLRDPANGYSLRAMCNGCVYRTGDLRMCLAEAERVHTLLAEKASDENFMQFLSEKMAQDGHLCAVCRGMRRSVCP